jgi:hypothetical protein
MAGTRMKIQMTDASFSRSPIQLRTMDNWYHSVSSHTLLEQRIKLSLGQWMDAQEAQRNDHFYFEGPNPKLLQYLLDDIEAILPGKRVRFEWTHAENFMVNGSTLDELLQVTGNEMGNTMASLPLLMIGTHRTFIRRQIGTMWNLDWNITIAGCVTTAVAMGVAIN